MPGVVQLFVVVTLSLLACHALHIMTTIITHGDKKGNAGGHRSAGLQNGQRGKCSYARNGHVCNAMHMMT